MIRRYAIGIVMILVLAIGAAVLAWARSPGTLPPQPIAFNHKLHLEKVQGISCDYCHQFVTSSVYAGLPSKHVCFGCHDPAEDNEAGTGAAHPGFAVLKQLSNAHDDIPWHRVTAMRADVFFSHRRHVTVGRLDCRECHAEMPERSSPPDRGPIQMSMSTCIQCHENNGVSVDCVACHR